MLRRNTRLLIAVLATVMVATTACTSGTTGDPAPNTAIASAQTSPAFPSESVPPGVEKDSVLDLNSTKDMTGVVTTVPINKSPYLDHLPDICALIPQTAMKQLGVETRKLGFRGTQLISQVCAMQHLNEGSIASSVAVNFYTNSYQELTAPDISQTLERNIPIYKNVLGSLNKLPESGPDNTTYKQECGTAWGTFFGGIVVRYRTSTPETVDPCARSVKAARIIAPYMPKSPSEMRPAS